MAGSLPSFVLCLSLLLLLAGRSMADANFINLVCIDSSIRSLCESMLTSDPKAQSCIDRPCLAHCGLEQGIKKASDTRNQVLKLLNDNPPPSAVPALNTCAGVYANVMSYLDQVLGLLEARNYGGADEKMGDVRHQAQLCDQAFAEHPNLMTQYNKDCEDVLVVDHDLVEHAV